MRRPGFTLIELLTVIAIAGVLAAISVGSFDKLKKSGDVNTSTQEFVSALRQAQSQALAGKGNANQTITVTTTTAYTAFGATVKLPSGLTFTSTVPQVITFKKLSGIVLDSGANPVTGDVVIDVTGGSVVKHIHITPIGTTSIQ